MSSKRLVLLLVVAALPFAGCGGASETPADDGEMTTGGTSGMETGGSAGTGVAGTSGAGGTAGVMTWPDRAAEPTDCTPGGPGAALPSESFTCTVGNRLATDGTGDVLWDWDASSLTLTEHGDRGDGTMWSLYWKYSPEGRVSRYGEPGGFYCDSFYDEHGVVVRVTSDRYPEALTQVEYDEAGRLVREEQAPPGGAMPYANGYGYDAQSRLVSSALDVAVDATIESRTTRTYHRDCSLELIEQQGSYHGWVDGAVIIRNRYFYDDADRLVRRESDGGGFFDTPADESVDEFDRWTYAPDGSVATFERDGTADDVGGPADGTVDESYAFSPECMKLVAFRRDLFRFPN